MLTSLCKGVLTIADRTIAIRVDEQLHQKIKLRLVEKRVTLKDYLLGLIEADLSSGEEKIGGYTRKELMDKANEIAKLLELAAKK